MERVKVGLKTSLIMRQESTSSRALALASDWYYLGRVQSFDEIQARIDGLTAGEHPRPPARDARRATSASSPSARSRCRPLTQRSTMNTDP